MSAQPIHVLHVEDDQSICRLVEHHLQALEPFAFEFEHCDRQDVAMKLFAEKRFDLVIVDYDLPQGNGLDFLQWLRKEDELIPVVAMSGIATPEVAAELLAVGADDYISKSEMTSESLQRSVHQALLRVDLFKALGPVSPGPDAEQISELREECVDLACWYLSCVDRELLTRLNNIEAKAQELEISPQKVQVLLEQIVDESIVRAPHDENARRSLLRPLLLELLVRLIGETIL